MIKPFSLQISPRLLGPLATVVICSTLCWWIYTVEYQQHPVPVSMVPRTTDVPLVEYTADVPRVEDREDLLLVNGTADVPLVKDGHWGQLHCTAKHFLLFAYSAFYDDRELAAHSGPAYVQIMGSSEYRNNVILMCILFYPGEAEPEIIRARPDRTSVPAEYQRKTFTEFVYACPIKRTGTGVVPESVSIGCSPLEKPTFRLKVQVPARPKQKRDFAICVCASYGSRNVYQLVEWMELQHILGVSKVTAYNHSMTDETARIFLHYADKGFVDFRQTVPFREETDGSPFHRMKMHQAPTVNDCIYRNMYSFNKILVLDYDELIVPRLHNKLSKMIAAIDRHYPTDHPARNYIFRNTVFPSEFSPDQNISSKLVTLRYRTSLQPELFKVRTKSIIDPMSCTNMHQHYCMRTTKHYSRIGHELDVGTKYGMSQHYKRYCDPIKKPANCKDTIKDMHSNKDDTMLRFKDELIPRVQKQLENLGLESL